MGAVLNGRRSFNGASDRLTIGMVSHRKTLDVKWDGHGFRSGGGVAAVGGEARGQHDALFKKMAGRDWQVDRSDQSVSRIFDHCTPPDSHVTCHTKI